MPKPSRLAGVKRIGLLVALTLASGLLVAAAAIPVVGTGGLLAKHAANAFDHMPVEDLSTVPSRSVILDSQGNVLAYYVPGITFQVNRQPVSFDQIAPVMRNAIVAIEDARFYQHGAFDLRGTLRAMLATLSGSPIQGGSTLAQQYVKNALVLTATTKRQQRDAIAVNLLRKLRELRIAANVEHEMTKDQLLAAYLNVAYFDNNAVGIQLAAGVYFGVPASQLTLPEAAMLAGMVENPAAYDPVLYPNNALARRNTVLAKMAALGKISHAVATKTEAMPLGLHLSYQATQAGCTANTASSAAFFCDYVLNVMRVDPEYAAAYKAMTTVGGLKIMTTLDPNAQAAANYAVDATLPANSGYYNPNNDIDTEVLVEPGTGYIRALAIDRAYGSGPGQTTINFAVNQQYGGSAGVQTGSSSKIFTLVTALEQGIPFGYNTPVTSPGMIGPFTSCDGTYVPPAQFNNAEGPGKGVFTLYNGTTQSINVFFVMLEQKVGLCNVVKTAVDMGMTRADGMSLLSTDPHLSPQARIPADQVSSFTLGAVSVSPLSMAGAYATVASGGVYCKPIAISAITDSAGKSLPIESAGCHQALDPGIAAAANHVLQGVLTSGTGVGLGIGIPAAGKTGTANGGYYAAFAGYTPKMVGYVSVFNPDSPTGSGAMVGYPKSCYRAAGGYQTCPGEMYGANAPGQTWNLTFTRLGLPAVGFGAVPGQFYSMGDGVSSPQPKCNTGTGTGTGTGGGNNGGGSNCPPSTGGTGGGPGGTGGGPPTG